MSPSPRSQASRPGCLLPEIIESDELTGVLLRQKFSPDLVEIFPVDPETFNKPPRLIFTPLLLKANRHGVFDLSNLYLATD